jgi:nucleoside-diphosphate-sugar epimerase
VSDTVLLTGGSRFIGTYVTQMLIERGDRVINLDVRPRSGPLAWLARSFEDRVVWEKGDVANWTQLVHVMRQHQPSKIVHLAASIDMADLESFPTQVLTQMVTGTVNVLEAMRLLGGVERLVNFSSIGVLPTRQYEPIDCNHPTLMAGEGPASGIYGAGKVAGEAFCWAYSDLFHLDVVQLRPSAVYGFFTTNKIFMNQLLEGALRGEKVRIPHGGALRRDYTHVVDVAGITVAALNAPADRLRHRVFYAASGMQPLVSGTEIAGIVREMVPGCDIAIDDAITPELERYEVKFRGVLDVQPVEEQLGYRIRYRDIRAGMLEYAERFCEYEVAHGRKPVAMAAAIPA